MSLSEQFKEATVSNLAWLAGSWQCEIWGGTFEEHWLSPKGGTMQGVGRHLDDHRTSFMEFMSIEQGAAGLTMWIIVGSPSHGERKAIPFKLTDLSSHTAIFENEHNDFPNRIAYTLISAQEIDCVLDGTRSGEACHEVFKFKTAGC